mmetsp:Transcript_21145/g.29638  ORF Transcript_21145/g.29638 Transcript_21145/m.29638 type:complete len:102 (+) Transcript_21145:1174-1479(+)
METKKFLDKQIRARDKSSKTERIKLMQEAQSDISKLKQEVCFLHVLRFTNHSKIHIKEITHAHTHTQTFHAGYVQICGTVQMNESGNTCTCTPIHACVMCT